MTELVGKDPANPQPLGKGAGPARADRLGARVGAGAIRGGAAADAAAWREYDPCHRRDDGAGAALGSLVAGCPGVAGVIFCLSSHFFDTRRTGAQTAADDAEAFLEPSLATACARDMEEPGHDPFRGQAGSVAALFDGLFSDLAGSTRIGGSADPGAYMDWISSFLDAMSDVAQAHGGFVEKYTGDGIMVVFGAPLPSIGDDKHRRDAEAACVCAFAMAETVEQMNKSRKNLAPYRIRIGIHSGEVLGGTIGTSGSLRYNIIGDSANIASRVEAYGKRIQDQVKRAATICLTHKTAELAQRVVDVRPVGTLTHDDQNHQLAIYELIGMTAGQ